MCSLKRYNWIEYGPFEQTINYADINDQPPTILTLIWVGSIGVHFVVGGGKLPSLSKSS